MDNEVTENEVRMTHRVWDLQEENGRLKAQVDEIRGFVGLARRAAELGHMKALRSQINQMCAAVGIAETLKED
jgi:hypothetical protein